MMSEQKPFEALRGLVAMWRDKAVRWSLAGPTVNGQTVDALRYCADELEALLAVPAAGEPPAPEHTVWSDESSEWKKAVRFCEEHLRGEDEDGCSCELHRILNAKIAEPPVRRIWRCAECHHEHQTTSYCGVITEAGGCMCRYEYIESVEPPVEGKQGEAGIEQQLSEAKRLRDKAVGPEWQRQQGRVEGFERSLGARSSPRSGDFL
jgi:hypothetical protein